MTPSRTLEQLALFVDEEVEVIPTGASGYGVVGREAVFELEPALAGVAGKKLRVGAGGHAGHAGGSLVEEAVRVALSKKLGGRVRRQHEVINELLEANEDVTGKTAREALLGGSAARAALGGRDLSKWSAGTPFEESQSDTADAILFAGDEIDMSDNAYALLDVKSGDLAKAGQAPNVISANKLFRICLGAVEAGAMPFDIVYIGVGYRVSGNRLVLDKPRAISLFSINEDVYINWASANQLQFHPLEVDQDYKGTPLQWADRFIGSYVSAKEEHARKLVGKVEAERDLVRLARRTAKKG